MIICMFPHHANICSLPKPHDRDCITRVAHTRRRIAPRGQLHESKGESGVRVGRGTPLRSPVGNHCREATCVPEDIVRVCQHEGDCEHCVQTWKVQMRVDSVMHEAFLIVIRVHQP
jgi:hypothetical protein